MLNPEANVGQDNDSDGESDEEGEDNVDFNGDEIQNMAAAESAAEIQNLIQLVANLPAVELL